MLDYNTIRGSIGFWRGREAVKGSIKQAQNIYGNKANCFLYPGLLSIQVTLAPKERPTIYKSFIRTPKAD